MSEEENVPEVASEPMDAQDEIQEEQKMVPLAALQAERRKRQEYETRNRVYEEILSQRKQEEPEEPEDPDALLTTAAYRQEKELSRREILEQVYQDMNPQAMEKINTYLKPILDKKPWLAGTLDNAVNRLARANEIVDDYIHLVNDGGKRASANDAARIVENSRKPRSPTETGKSAQPTGLEYLKSIQGKKEFREYRANLLKR
jgi:hypothetical protein